jgi:hypothetical protein
VRRRGTIPLVAKARELSSRWLEEINNNPWALPAPGGKYQISKQIEQTLTPAGSRSTGRGRKKLSEAASLSLRIP